MALLGDDKFGDAKNALHLFLPRIMRGFVDGVGLLCRFVIIFAIHEPDHIGVLLDRTGFAKVGQHRTLVLALFNRTAELRKRDHGQAQFLGQGFQTTANFGNFINAVVARTA